MRRGVTLLELLLALALLAGLTAGLASWVNVSAQLTVTAREDLIWKQSAEAVLRLIHDEIMTADNERTTSADSDTARFTTDGESLRIRTRAIGPVSQTHRGDITVSYRLQPEGFWLIRRIDDTDRQQRLIGDVAGFHSELIEDGEDAETRTWLQISLTLRDGRQIERRFLLP